MRLDKYLKVSRLIKRRTVANEACDAGRVMVNGRVAKASLDVKVGDVIEIAFGNKSVRAQVLQVADTSVRKKAKRCSNTCRNNSRWWKVNAFVETIRKDACISHKYRRPPIYWKQ